MEHNGQDMTTLISAPKDLSAIRLEFRAPFRTPPNKSAAAQVPFASLPVRLRRDAIQAPIWSLHIEQRPRWQRPVHPTLPLTGASSKNNQHAALDSGVFQSGVCVLLAFAVADESFFVRRSHKRVGPETAWPLRCNCCSASNQCFWSQPGCCPCESQIS